MKSIDDGDKAVITLKCASNVTSKVNLAEKIGTNFFIQLLEDEGDHIEAIYKGRTE